MGVARKTMQLFKIFPFILFNKRLRQEHRFQAMVCNTQNKSVYGLCTSVGIQNKQDLFPSLGEGREIPTLLGSLEGANLLYWNSGVFTVLPKEDTECLI
jgi:hypothetical protein